MDCFVKRFQPDQYEDWVEGNEKLFHPEDDTKKIYRKKSNARTTATQR